MKETRTYFCDTPGAVSECLRLPSLLIRASLTYPSQGWRLSRARQEVFTQTVSCVAVRRQGRLLAAGHRWWREINKQSLIPVPAPVLMTSAGRAVGSVSLSAGSSRGQEVSPEVSFPPQLTGTWQFSSFYDFSKKSVLFHCYYCNNGFVFQWQNSYHLLWPSSKKTVLLWHQQVPSVSSGMSHPPPPHPPNS